MKKFQRLPPEQRKNEIKEATLQLFRQKGFAATTMENIVEQVTLSKGGVYRLYPSTSAILADLMLDGMHLRNAYYAQKVQEEIAAGKSLTNSFLVEMIGDSLLLYPELSSVYVEFLWEKQRNPDLEALYQHICRTTAEETTQLIRQYHADSLLLSGQVSLTQMTELMNAAILSLHVLNLWDWFRENKHTVSQSILQILNHKEQEGE